MITTVSLNPSIDRTLSVESFRYGGMNRVQSSRDDACGKAVNVSIVASRLGAKARCVGFLAERDAEAFESRLRENGVEYRFVSVPGRARVNMKLLDESARVITEINERGAFADESAMAALTGLIRDLADEGGFLTLTGSMPPGCPANYYEKVIRMTRGRCRVVLDADGEALRSGIRALPYLIKPNLAETEELLGEKVRSVGEMKKAASRFAEKGIGLVCLTAGGEGALITDGEKTFFAPALKLNVRSTVGAGDSLMGGLLAALDAGAALDEAFRAGAAAAAASVVSEGTDLVDPLVQREMLSKIKIQRV